MNFVSFTWLAWMVGTFSLYWLVNDRWRDYLLIAATLAFLAVYSISSAALLSGFTLSIYYLTRGSELSSLRAIGLSAAIVLVLLWFKINHVGTGNDFLSDTAIPLGLSYYAFRCVHYIVEMYKGMLPRHGLKEFVGYLFFLPTIVVGPIHRFEPFNRDVRRKRWDARQLSEGMQRILYGYVKITFLANYLISIEFANLIATVDPANQALIYYGNIVRNGLNLYLQFSGFSDIAIGFSLMLGYRVMENFRWPYFQKNISDFWRCWHISLTSWCRDYIYTVVMAATRSPVLAIISTLVVIGLWHEVSTRYLLWGLYHGVGIAVWQQFQKIKPSLPQVTSPTLAHVVDGLSILFTVHFVWFGFVIVSQPNLAAVLQVYQTVLFGWV